MPPRSRVLDVETRQLQLGYQECSNYANEVERELAKLAAGEKTLRWRKTYVRRGSMRRTALTMKLE
jgi:hypothetical protein